MILFTLPNLHTVSGVPLNADNAIVVRNVTPVAWSGREYGVEILKETSRLMRVEVLVGEEASFVLEPILYFGIVRSGTFIGKFQMFKSAEIEGMCEALESFDLSSHPNGLKVILKQSADGKFTIIGENM